MAGSLCVPSGHPAWQRAAVIGDYGGSTAKADHLDKPPLNVDTDLGAAQLMRLAEHMVSITRTAPFATLTVKCNDATMAAPTVLRAYLASGLLTNISYEGDHAPDGFPQLLRMGNGAFTVDFGTYDYPDAYGSTADFYPEGGTATVVTGGNYVATVTRPTLLGVRVDMFVGTTGLAVADQTCVVNVW